MKTLHVVYSYPPDPAGGTERYVAGLCEDLVTEGVRSVVAAPAPHDARYAHEGTPVRRFAMSAELPLEGMYGAGDTAAAEAFERVLADEAPDVVHLHAVTPACSVQLVRRTARRQIPMVLTYHTPTVTCLRGTLMLWGESPCDGRIEIDRCAGCAAAAHGVGRQLAEVVGRMPTAVGRGLGRLGLQGGVMTAARLSSLTSLHRQATIEILMTVDRIVALAPWVRQVLAENGVTAEKIVDCPHGVAAVPVPPPRTRTGEIRIAHLGRLHPTKGTELLVDAMRGVRSSRLGLDIFGIAQGGDGEAMAARIAAAAAADPRIRLHAAIDSADVPAALSAYDAVAVPSQWMETGPLVVLEAFASGTPVLGSDLGGIADKVTHGLNGLLVSPCGSTRAWTEALEQCASDDGLLARLRQGVSRPRSQRAVAREMAGLYAAVTSRAGRTADAPGAA